MKDVQKRLDKGAKVLARLMQEAEEGAREFCAAGDAEASAAMHRVAAHLRMAYAEGRTLRTVDGIRPAFGGDGK